MRVGIFGGSFDPIHIGHLILAETCREQLRLDEVRFVPTALAPHKQNRRPTPPEHRAAMIELAIAGREGFVLSTIELDRGGVNYTADTLAAMARELPGSELFLLLGADMFNDLPNWRRPADVCRLALPVGVERAGMPPPEFERLRPLLDPDRFEAARAATVVMPLVGISSSLLRERAAQGKSIRFLTPRAVEAYIESHRLYADNSETSSPPKTSECSRH